MAMKVTDRALHFGDHLTVSFMRTLRVPDDDQEYPLPPGLGEYPVFRVDDFADRVPESWKKHGGVFIPMYQREAMWISLSTFWWRPVAIKIGIGTINAVTGTPWRPGLSADPQDYVVCPDQPWLDGINAGNGFIKQFVAMPLMHESAVARERSAQAGFGGIHLTLHAAKPGRFPDRPGACDYEECELLAPSQCEMRLGAGGRLRQKIYPDEHGLDTWDLANHARIYVHVANSAQFRDITGEDPPPTTVTADYYTRAGLPWFDLYDEGRGAVPVSDAVPAIESLWQVDHASGRPKRQGDRPLRVPGYQVVMIRPSALEAARTVTW
ncbi:MAG: hypothetical protein JXQ73_32150 [Phycisphaerae bacterium]|nr:hypothetical protein [Phycisphaerae bacterium]